MEDDSIDSKHADFDEEMLNHIGGNRGREDIGEIRLDNKKFRVSTEVVIKATGHETTVRGGFSIRLGDPESRGRESRS
jgi:hypothetical protein